MGRVLLCALACVAMAAAMAAPAAGDTLTFTKDNNVWLANPDGSGLYRVTSDGTAGAPYETPSLADDGTVVAIRQTPGQRRQIYRMTQSGGLLNPPINTPAPGTGAIDAKVSPNGALVAYWFVTTVFDPTCTFCVDVSERVLLSHSDRFTGASEVGTPNMGGHPSWLTNDTITLGTGSPTQYYYTVGMPQAAEWFADHDLVSGGLESLLDAEVAPSGDRLAVVRGDHQESIFVLKMNGPPPAKPTAECALTNPAGSFVDPTWSADGRLLAWQEDDGVWTMSVPADVTDCAAYGIPTLRVPGAKNPDLGSGALNPGPRPPCGNPGNPTACQPCTGPTCQPCTGPTCQPCTSPTCQPCTGPTCQPCTGPTCQPCPGPGNPACPPQIDRTPPSISAFSLTNRRFRIARGATAVSARRRGPLGTTFRYSLSERAAVTLTIERALPGRRVGSRCRRPARPNRGRRRCTRYLPAGVLTRRNQGPGPVSTPFTGRIANRKLPLGSYRATIGATDPAGNHAKSLQITFTIVP